MNTLEITEFLSTHPLSWVDLLVPMLENIDVACER